MESSPRDTLTNDITKIKGLINDCKQSHHPEVKWVQTLLTAVLSQKYQRLEELASANDSS